MDSDSFHYFSKLPLELRRAIWQYCLPHRVVEEDTADFLLDGNESRQACWADRITRQNAQLPMIAFVNRESRQIALEQGHKLKLEEVTSLDSIWVQPHRDRLHLNWTRARWIAWGGYSDHSSPIAMFLWRAEEHGMQPSVVAEIIHHFRLKPLFDAEGAPDDLAFLYREPSIRCQGVNNIEVCDIASCADMADCTDKQSLGIAMAAVSLHITREAALRSGLFGLLGDAPVQMVDVDDEARLREFHALFMENALDKEPAVKTRFETFLGSRFQTAVESWTRWAEWLILAEMWRSARDEHIDILGTRPGLAWAPEVVEQDYIFMEKHLPNDEHPWVKQARHRSPKLRPQIMVRYCTNECYIKERLPNNFGKS
ncbi:hypothetical protein PT974_06935 [Cladobotryum mycophilum]|uniref:2EXR domain-containing protein n=1 Tax=Cladobotryum mycophilum TaxID=491253 RepID=A0ABR0SN13_9HYPO